MKLRSECGDACCALAVALRDERILPMQLREPGKVSVRRTEDQPVLDGQRCEVRIRYEVRVYARRREKFAENLAMAFGRLRHPHPLGLEPGERLPPRV